MALAIEPYNRDRHLEGMSDVYNAETAFEPHIAPLNPRRFVDLVESKSYFDPAGVFVAVEGGRVVGWVHGCVAPPTEDGQDPTRLTSRIRMLIFPRDRLDAGRALTDEATAWLRRFGRREILAMHAREGYPFYRGLWLGGESMGASTLPHVQMVLECAGYRNDQQDVFMTAEMSAPPARREAGILVEYRHGPAKMSFEGMRESWIGFEPQLIEARAGGEFAGGCWWVMLPHVAERLGAPCMNIYNLWIEERFRRKGIGAALVSRAMIRVYELGARHCSLITPIHNALAHATYAKCGWRPKCIVMGRTLTLDRQA